MTPTPPTPHAASALRLLGGGAVTGILLYTYVRGIPGQGASLVDYFGYFTNLTSLLAAGILIASSLISLRARTVPSALTSARAVAVACMVLPYPVVWLGVVLVRGATDGWVPYGFLLPERGAASLATHVAGLLLALLASGALVWALSRIRLPRPSRSSGARPAVSPRERGGDPTVA